ncbi:putative sporulation protein YtxC [Caldibacillus thermolactis]|uniref:Sporulation protein YtxC n=1 Tax=Pallidibacillus thermolactis TaxID=251051 RepID=A0ABT2WFL5_9BACI|nr:sporulation protein YtxC [Pallidibacillus thermolactis]MCU9594465.1 putative sporulation protein YtxC [Pallidibacillus thermolactis]MCU9601250.1 putative sporulation protein YtxC [Pallidibacillus thermolactis subsp. kokeshiiformis]MED1673306.1 sporulation protein YtxC [Pallidibacillus thermolactis subsp. kokeshiiformis]
MIKIQFQNREELDFLYSLFKKSDSNMIQVQKGFHDLTIQMDDQNREKGLLIIHKQLKKLIMHKKRVDWCKRVIQEEFFYTDEDEQMQIINILFSILDGKRKDLTVDMNHEQEERQIDHALNELLFHNRSFSFDAFVMFRLRTYLEKLSSYIETAIDEYKMEQDYQAFIHYLRSFLMNRKPQMKTIYLVHDDGFTFFNEQKQLMKRSELNKRIDRKLLSDHPVYVDSITIAPLISIAPEHIYLFTDHPDFGIIQTLKNIFEEKITILSLREFSNYSISNKF